MTTLPPCLPSLFVSPSLSLSSSLPLILFLFSLCLSRFFISLSGSFWLCPYLCIDIPRFFLSLLSPSLWFLSLSQFFPFFISTVFPSKFLCLSFCLSFSVSVGISLSFSFCLFVPLCSTLCLYLSFSFSLCLLIFSLYLPHFHSLLYLCICLYSLSVPLCHHNDYCSEEGNRLLGWSRPGHCRKHKPRSIVENSFAYNGVGVHQ